MANSLHAYRTLSGSVSLAAATAETVVQLTAPATRDLQVTEITGALPSTTATDAPVLVEILAQTTAGTASAATPAPTDPRTPAALATAQITFTAEPTAGTIRFRTMVTPVGGTFVIPLSRPIVIPASTRAGLRITAPQAQTGAHFEMAHEE